MIQIRAVTYNLSADPTSEHFDVIGRANSLWSLQNYFIRTYRVSLVPFNKPVSIDYFKKINELCNKCDVRWFNVPLDPWGTENKRELFEFGYNVLKNYRQSFVNINCVKNGKFNSDTIDRSVRLIKKVSTISNNGDANFRLGISGNIGYDCPFFPFSMSSGKFSFSIALELTQEINRIVANMHKKDLLFLRNQIISTIEPQIDEIYNYAQKISKETGLQFDGFDFSLAPIIDQDGSVIPILRKMGVDEFGQTGTMFATAYLTNILKFFAKQFPSVGFSGVMYSLLEDLELCRINNEKGVKIEDLIKLSTMCGCGIDMVPVTADITDSQLRTAIIEIGGISSRLQKPLGIRFLPIPRSKLGEKVYTDFNEDADFIANTRVLSLGDNSISDFGADTFKFLSI